MISNLINRLTSFGIISSFRKKVAAVNEQLLILLDLFIPVFGALVLGWELMLLYFYFATLIEAIFTVIFSCLKSGSKRIFFRVLGALGELITIGVMFSVYLVFVLMFSLLTSSSSLQAGEYAYSKSQETAFMDGSFFLSWDWDSVWASFIIIILIQSVYFAKNYIFTKDKERRIPKFYDYIQNHVFVLHLSILVTGFLLIIPVQLGNAVTLVIYRLTGYWGAFEIQSRITNSIIALVIGLISLWNRGRIKRTE